MANFIILAICLAVFGHVHATTTVAPPTHRPRPEAVIDARDNVCEMINVTIESLTHIPEQKFEPKPFNTTLFRLCDSSRFIDFTIPVQNLTYFGDFFNHFFENSGYGDKFLAIKGHDLIKYKLVLLHPVNDLTDEQHLKYQTAQITLTVRHYTVYKSERFGPFHAQLFHPNTSAEFPQGLEGFANVRLSPGWRFIEQNHMVSQVLFPEPNSTLKIQTVEVMSGWFDIDEKDGFHAKAETLGGPQFVTVFFRRPQLNDTRLFPGYTDVTLVHEGTVKSETVRLIPGWTGELLYVTHQTLVPGRSSGLRRTNVTVHPRAIALLKGEEAVHAKADLKYMKQDITIYFGDKST